MSIFNEEAAPTKEGTSEPQATSFLEQLVAKKGDQFRDPEAIAKKALHADEHIEQLKADIARLKTYEELIEGLKADPKAGLEQLTKPKEEPLLAKPEENTTPPAGDFESQIEAFLEKKKSKDTAQSNLQAVEHEIQANFGERAGDIVKAKAQELGMSLASMSAMAAESPKAFLQLVGVETKTQTRVVVPSSVNTEGLSIVEKNPEYYTRELAKNPKLVQNAQFTQEMYAAFARTKK